jgi:hypothetical protein
MIRIEGIGELQRRVKPAVERVDAFDWHGIGRDLDRQGNAIMEQLLSPEVPLQYMRRELASIQCRHRQIPDAVREEFWLALAGERFARLRKWIVADRAVMAANQKRNAHVRG